MLDKVAVFEQVKQEIGNIFKARPEEDFGDIVIEAGTRFSELGISSLDLAELISNLESIFGTDPFAELVPITSVVTIDDMCNAYLCAAQGDAIACESDGGSRVLQRPN